MLQIWMFLGRVVASICIEELVELSDIGAWKEYTLN